MHRAIVALVATALGCFAEAPSGDDEAGADSTSAASTSAASTSASGSMSEGSSDSGSTSSEDSTGADETSTQGEGGSSTGSSPSCPCPAESIVCEDFEGDLGAWPDQTGGAMLSPKIQQDVVACDTSSLYSSVTANDSSTIGRGEDPTAVLTGAWSVGGHLWIDADCIDVLDRVRLVELSFEVGGMPAYWFGLNVGNADTELQVGDAVNLLHNLETRTKITETWFEFRIDFSFESLTAELWMDGVSQGAIQTLATPPDLSTSIMIFTIGTERIDANGAPDVCDVYHDQVWIAPTP
jgi:hypothetical protein